ncbi:MAG: glycosyltransferase family 9 protein [Pirellulales bacterium]|nr:glycosyltransferase family 9 protein [Pirellulales bacterium]
MADRIPLDSLHPKRICLIKPSAFGDIIQTLPVLGMLRARFPAAYIAWVAKAPLAELLRGHPQLDDVIPLPYPHGLRAKIAAFRQTLGRLRKENFDLALDFQGLLRSGLMTWSTRAARRVGSSLSREFSHLAYTDRVDVGPWHQPALETFVPIARALGCTGPPPPAFVHVAVDAVVWSNARLSRLPRPVLAVNPGAQWITKRWPAKSFAALARLAVRHHSASIVIVGGPGERELGMRVEQAIRSQKGDSAQRADATIENLAGETSLPQLAAVCQYADVFLSGDSGPMHLAAALKTPTVGIFTCTDEVRSGPRGDLPDQPHRCVSTKVACAASYVTRCRKLDCMNELTPARVWPELDEMLRDVTSHGNSRIAG